MIDLFTIFSKGGIVLWCFQGGAQELVAPSVNALIKTIFLQERSSTAAFSHGSHTLKFKLDNEFELIFVVVYQSVIQLSYIDKLVDDVHRAFRDRYRQRIDGQGALLASMRAEGQHGRACFDGFRPIFEKLLDEAERSSIQAPPVKMKTFEQSTKSQKTVASMIERPNEKKEEPKGKKGKDKKQGKENGKAENDENVEPVVEEVPPTPPEPEDDGLTEIERNRLAFMNKQAGGGKKAKTAAKPQPSKEQSKKQKQQRRWEMGGTRQEAAMLDYSKKDGGGEEVNRGGEDDSYLEMQRQYVGTKKGDLAGIEYESEDEVDEEEEEAPQDKGSDGGGGFGVFSAFRSLVGSKKLTLEQIEPALEKFRDHLISKNVASDIAQKMCDSVGQKLEGKVIGTFSGVASTVKETLRESLVQLLSPRRRVDILRDVIEAKRQNRPYTIVFCGVNGVGKSTNLAKVTFWLNENGHSVLIAACDTFRSGAVEQLRTHVRHLNHLHPNSVDLYEQGYGKDPATIALHAIGAAAGRYDVVLVDTAGRMQDNEPLMRALAKLIHVNEPDAVLFVGEALVGNEAVDQLTKFNQALADHAAPGSTEPRLIDGIVLTKFDTIDDKVGAAISMTYITGQPIVFVGTGQTYNDLKNLNPNAVVAALLK